MKPAQMKTPGSQASETSDGEIGAVWPDNTIEQFMRFIGSQYGDSTFIEFWGRNAGNWVKLKKALLYCPFLSRKTWRTNH